MRESYHTSRMRETCTSGSQEGRGKRRSLAGPFNPSFLAYSTAIKHLELEARVGIVWITSV